MNDFKKDIELAQEVRKKAYTPYTNYKVGCVLTTKLGKKYTGCNVENHGLLSICAERVAFTKAISEGENEFQSILVIGNKKDCTPCGYCRQFMSEFVEKDFKIYTVNDEKINEYTIEELLPYNFSC